MGIMRDVFDTVRDAGSISNDTIEKTLGRRKYSSIARRSMEGTLQFPTIISKAIDIETAQMISKALERQFVSFTQVVLSMNPMLDLSADKDAIGYLRKFHQNSGVRTSGRDAANALTSLLSENYDGFADASGERLMFTGVYEGTTGTIDADNKRQLHTLVESFEQGLLNDKYTPAHQRRKYGKQTLTENFNQRMLMEDANPLGDLNDELTYLRIQQTRKSLKDHPEDRKLLNARNDRDVERHALDMQQKELQIQSLQKQMEDDPTLATMNQLKIDQLRMSIEKTADDIRRNATMKYDLPNEMLKNNDVRKANELIPTTMHVRTILVNQQKESQGTMDFIIGIKSTLHPVTSEEMVSNVVGAVKSRGKVFNFLRWTTGETNFFKDFLFNINEMKDDVFTRSKGASQWWIALKRRRSLAKIKASMFTSKDLLPNATLVLSMDEANYIKSEYGFDVTDTRIVNKVMERYFLLGFVVVDNAAQVVHFLFDGQEDYQSVSFTGLEREGKAGGGSDLKDVLKLVQRI